MSDISVYASYFKRYTSLVPETNVAEALKNQAEHFEKYFQSIDEEKSCYAYEEGKWTLKEMLQHMLDTERIFAFRALAITRKETATLPGFDENIYAANSEANNRSWQSLVDEMKALRTSTIHLFNSFSEEMLESVGSFSTLKGSTNTLGLILVGHVYHHINITNERYL